MKSLFYKIEVISSSSISKKDKKSINKIFNIELLNNKEEYKQVKLKNRSSLILDGNEAILFIFNNKYVPTIKYIEKGIVNIKTIFLDKGAVGPLQRGANVMAPGVFKYIDMCKTDFCKGEILCVNIIDFGILAVGIALVDKKDIKNNTNGEVIEILHINNDELYNTY